MVPRMSGFIPEGKEELVEDLHGWNADPSGRHQERYFSGGQPTTLVRDAGRESHDPVALTSASVAFRGDGASTSSLPPGPNGREGWHRDPSGRHQVRYFDVLGNPSGWVSDGGQAFEDPVAIIHVPPGSPSETSGPREHPSETTAASSTAALQARPAGWYRNAANPAEIRFWDGAEWRERQPEPASGSIAVADQQREPSLPISPLSIEAGAWHADPFGRHRYRWLVAGVPTLFVSDENGQVCSDDPRNTVTLGPDNVDSTSGSDKAPAGALSPAPVRRAPARWYPDPVSPSRLRYWDGSEWTDGVLDQSPY
jgi:hypothetical protein